MTDLERTAVGSTFRLHAPDGTSGRLFVPMPGLHNARNAAAAATAALAMGVGFDAIAEALSTFRVSAVDSTIGARRTTCCWSTITPPSDRGARRHRRGDGPRPSPDRGGLSAASVQPHGGALAGLRRFVRRCGPAHHHRHLLLWREAPGGGHLPADRRCGAGGAAPPTVVHLPDRETLAAEVVERLEPGDVCLTLGAGDLVTLADELLPLLESR